MQVCKYASMHIYKSMQVYANVQVCKYSHICKYTSMHICMYAVICKYSIMLIHASMHIYANIQVCKYSSMFIQKLNKRKKVAVHILACDIFLITIFKSSSTKISIY